MSRRSARGRARSVLAPGIGFCRELATLEIDEFQQLLADPALVKMSESVAFTWLVVLSLVARHQHGLTFATIPTIAAKRMEFYRLGSSVDAVKRHIRLLQRLGLLLRFAEHRAKDEKAIKRLPVIVVLFPDGVGGRSARSIEARSLVHGWGSSLWGTTLASDFDGPVVRRKGTFVVRRRVKFADLVPLRSDFADLAAKQQSVCASVDRIAPDLPPLTTTCRIGGKNRASAGMSLLATGSCEVPGSPSQLPEDRAADARLLGDSERPAAALQGVPGHRRPQGGIWGHPRPEGGTQGSEGMAQEVVA